MTSADVANLTEDVEYGFDMVRRGPGWRDRNDGRYQNPVSLERLRKDNFEYVRARTSVGRAAPVQTSPISNVADVDNFWWSNSRGRL